MKKKQKKIIVTVLVSILLIEIGIIFWMLRGLITEHDKEADSSETEEMVSETVSAPETKSLPTEETEVESSAEVNEMVQPAESTTEPTDEVETKATEETETKAAEEAEAKAAEEAEPKAAEVTEPTEPEAAEEAEAKAEKEEMPEEEVTPKAEIEAIPETDEEGPFYGIWCFASDGPSDAEALALKMKEDVRFQEAGIEPVVLLSSEWDNLNSRPYYVVSAGRYASEEAANEMLPTIQSCGYTNAFVKYTGERRAE